MKTYKVSGVLPLFPGFYNTIFEENEEPELNHLSDDFGFDVKWDDVEWDYKSYQEEVAEDCCSTVEAFLREMELPISISYERINSPREYNFRNDEIQISIEFTDDVLEKIKDLMFEHEEMFSKYLEETFKSRSGFISFHSHNFNTWMHDYLFDTESDMFGSYVCWALDGLLQIEGQNYDTLYDNTDITYITGDLKMTDVDEEEDMIAEIFSEQYIERFGEHGYAAVAIKIAQAAVALFGGTIPMALAEAEPKMITDTVMTAREIPATRMREAEKFYSDGKMDDAADIIRPFTVFATED